MNRQRWLVWLRVVFVLAATPVIFILVQQPVRGFEIRVDVDALRLVGVHGVPLVVGTSALLQPSHGGEFWVYLSPSCSSLASITTLACIAAVLPRRVVAGRSRLVALLAASAAIFVGNLLRIDLSMGAGLLAGRGMLVLFHDWAGSVFGFAYTMGGFIVMLWLLLPSRGRAIAGVPAAASSAPGTSPAPA